MGTKQARRYYGKQPMYSGKGRDKAYYERRSRVLDLIVPFIYDKEKRFDYPSADTNGNLRLAFSTQYLYDPTDKRADRSGFRAVSSDDYTDLKGSKRASTSRLRWLYDRMMADAPQLDLLDDNRLARLVDRHYNGTPGMFSKDVSKKLHAVPHTAEALTAWADGDDGISSYGTTVRGIDDPEKRKTIEDALKARVEEAKAYVDSREVHQAAEGGDAAGEEPVEVPPAEPRSAAPVSGPRIVINPSTFKNRKDALCVAFNERFRIAMEEYGFEPKSEPTPAQRKFFADTAYADDEVQLRRTILARILTLDTSIS